jgi:Ser/Thr protein kinase RdoA (MazF antagonist)
MTDAGVDRVLTATRPSFTVQDAAALAHELFGIERSALAVESERDQTFLVDGARSAVLKISNAAEDPARLDMEALAAQRVALPWLVPGTPYEPSDSRAYRAPTRRAGETHQVLMYTRLPGRASVHGASLNVQAVRDWGPWLRAWRGRCVDSGTRRQPA